jgi:hypothetical protein
MRSQLATAVRDIFSRHMKQEFSQFSPIEPTDALLGGLLYQWPRARNLTCYIYLQISAKDYQDSFMVELSCSRGEFPINLVAFGPSDIRDGCVRFRLPELYRQEWSHKSRRVPWWWIRPPVIPQEVTAKAVERATVGKRPLIDEGMPIEQALPLVEPQVQDAIDRIKRFGIPFFEQFAQSHAGKT